MKESNGFTQLLINTSLSFSSYLVLPRVFFPADKDEETEQGKLSVRAKLMYMLMLDRAKLSKKNGLVDEENRIFIIYSEKALCHDLQCGETTVYSCKNELKKIGLIDIKKQGLGKPARIYVKVPYEYKKDDFDTTGEGGCSGYDGACLRVINYLNDKAGKHYRPENEHTTREIKERLKEGFTENDMKTVIDKKVKAWGSDEKMERYLRPSTLFSAKNFESYLNEKDPDKCIGKPQNTFSNFEQRKYNFKELENVV